MDRFTATNGITVFVRDGGTVQFQHGTRDESCGILQVFPHSEWWQAIREFFRAEEDERLGRWRWGTSDITVRPVTVNETPFLRAIDDAAGTFLTYEIKTVRELVTDDPTQDERVRAMRAYLDSQPREAWHDAKPGEAWVVTRDGVERALLVEDFAVEGRCFADASESDTFPIEDSGITAGRRIWPLEGS